MVCTARLVLRGSIFANPRSAQWPATELWVGESRVQLCRATPFASLAQMPPPVPEQLSRTIETLYRSESGRVLATLVHLLGDLDLAEEAMHEAFAAALESWPQTGIPDSPRPWLISTWIRRILCPELCRKADLTRISTLF